MTDHTDHTEGFEPPLEGVGALPRSIEPPHDLWPAIETRLAPRRTSWRPWLALAAAVLLVVASSAITALVLRRAEGPAGRVPVATNPAPTAHLVAEAGYARAAEELGRALAERRDRLHPETVRTLERNLAIIDRAIAESRAALAADPGDPDLEAILLASWDRKLTLLRQAADLPQQRS
jgi:hypothetical protein